MTPDPGANVDAKAIQVLTEAARRTNVDGSECDFAGFLSYVLAATAANLGGVERLLAGRPGSWEASLVRSLVEGTVGDDQKDLLRLRTEPVVVTLNVAEILEGLDLHPGLLTVDEAIYACEERFQDDGRLVQDDDPELDNAIATIEDRYTHEFAAYATRFAAAVVDAAADIGSAAPRVLVEADTDPQSSWWSADARVNTPASTNQADLAHELWHAAHDVVALPNVDIDLRPSGGPGAGNETGTQRLAQ